MIAGCSLRSDKIKQGRKNKTGGMVRLIAIRQWERLPARRSKKKKFLRGEFKLWVSLIMKRRLKMHSDEPLL